MRITMIIREMVRSFRRSLWVNLLMTVQMSICFFLVITMMTYYFDVGNSQEYNTVWHIQDREWYKLRMILILQASGKISACIWKSHFWMRSSAQAITISSSMHRGCRWNTVTMNYRTVMGSITA